jgi:hypothetical protein
VWLAEKEGKKLNLAEIDPRFLVKMPVDVKLVITWDADDLCIDLHGNVSGRYL